MPNPECPTFCTVSPHDHAGGSTIHEGEPVTWTVADRAFTLSVRWRSYDDGPPLMLARMRSEENTVEIEMSTCDAETSIGHLESALTQIGTFPRRTSVAS